MPHFITRIQVAMSMACRVSSFEVQHRARVYRIFVSFLAHLIRASPNCRLATPLILLRG